MHVAAANGNLEVVKLLVELGAYLNPVDRFHSTPLDEAVQNFNDPTTIFLKSKSAEHGKKKKLETQLIIAAAKGDSDSVAEAAGLLRHGTIDASCADYDGRTPLHVAVNESNLDMVALLMKHGADPNAQDRWGFTPLSDARRREAKNGPDGMLELLQASPSVAVAGTGGPPEEASAVKAEKGSPKTVLIFAFLEILFVILLEMFTEYSPDTSVGAHAAAEDQFLDTHYGMFQDIHVMIFVGFGFLMTFLRKNQYSSVGWTFLVSALCIQWYTLAGGFLSKVVEGGDALDHKIQLDLSMMLRGDFAAGAVMITFGVVLGKVSPLQMLSVAMIEVAVYALNEAFGGYLQVTDIGGTIIIHMFGAYFGLAFSLALGRRAPSPDNASVYHADIFAMIGSVFLWLYWPSFNAVLATGNSRHRAVVNTILSLTGSCVAAFLSSAYFRGAAYKFNMVDVQNATLAGGVVMGASADLNVGGGLALLIGASAGVLSVVGYCSIQGALQSRLGLEDTCGVNNLHGMPSILGALIGVAYTRVATLEDYGEQLSELMGARPERSANEQAMKQLLYLASTLVFSSVTGYISGVILRTKFFEPIPRELEFSDSAYWQTPGEELPYYFDEAGEIDREQIRGNLGGNSTARRMQRDDVKALTALHRRVNELDAVVARKHRESAAQLLQVEMAHRYMLRLTQPDSSSGGGGAGGKQR